MCYRTGHHTHFRGMNVPHARSPLPSMIKGMMNHMQNSWGKFEGWVPHYIEEYKEYYKMIVPLPGFAKEEVRLSLISDNLNLKAKKDTKPGQKHPEMNKEVQLNRNRMIKQIFTNLWQEGIDLDIKLPSNANTEQITSKMTDGLLQIKLGKKEPREINVDEENNA